MALPSKQAVAMRLVNHVRVDDDGCWLYASQSRRKRPMMSLRASGRTRVCYVSRVAAWIWLGFDLDSPLNVLHRCDKPRCFRPECLFIGTQKDNVQDALVKGRWTQGSTPASRACAVKGEDHARSRLTAQDIRAIRKEGDSGTPRHDIARQYGIQISYVGKICRRENWKHIN